MTDLKDQTNTMNKEIHFYMDASYPFYADQVCMNYDDTRSSIERGYEVIHTTSLVNLSFDLLDLGYRIFVHRRGKSLECKLGSMEGTYKEIRRPHNILKMLIAGVFDDVLSPECNNSKSVM